MFHSDKLHPFSVDVLGSREGREERSNFSIFVFGEWALVGGGGQEVVPAPFLRGDFPKGEEHVPALTLRRDYFDEFHGFGASSELVRTRRQAFLWMSRSQVS